MSVFSRDATQLGFRDRSFGASREIPHSKGVAIPQGVPKHQRRPVLRHVPVRESSSVSNKGIRSQFFFHPQAVAMHRSDAADCRSLRIAENSRSRMGNPSQASPETATFDGLQGRDTPCNCPFLRRRQGDPKPRARRPGRRLSRA
jgi:hypothetical protein